MINKYIATAKIVNPSAVSARASAEGMIAHPGAIYVSIPEMGFEEPNLIYCRYGLSFPYLKIQMGWRVWVEPTIGDDSRFCYTGIVDCGGDITPTDADEMILQFVSQLFYASTQGTIHISSDTASEPFVLGNKLLTWITSYINMIYNLHTHTTTATIGASGTLGVISPPVLTGTPPTDILSVKIFGE